MAANVATAGATPQLGDAMLLEPILKHFAPNIDDKLIKVLSAIAKGTFLIARKLRVSSGDAKVGKHNLFGDDQLEVDVATDEIIFAMLRQCGAVATAASEETPDETALGGDGYSVGFDPLDGSSVIPANFAVGSIFGVWPGSHLLNRTGREQHAAAMSVYGSRTSIAMALGAEVTGGDPVAFELTLHEDTLAVEHHCVVVSEADQITWLVSKEKFEVAPAGKVFAPGNLRATADNERYAELVNYWISNRYTLRYTGGMMPDVYHILIKGKGVFSNVASASAKAKLRLLYEVAPIGFIMECAGAVTCTVPKVQADSDDPEEAMSVLDVPIDHLDRRLGACFGGAEEVAYYRKVMFGDASASAA
mmetsp:Transcript_19845/g.60130  ORF Transcript_19845/g.60130 Transcript_19845/m.60130 type:complete len:362 (-) Transcript_19845:286-1371(-)